MPGISPGHNLESEKDMKLLNEFSRGDGAHCGLADWYPEQEAALKAALKAHAAFDTGWYSSKKQIASARVFSRVGEKW